VVICLERGADLHMAHLMPLLLIVYCFSKIQIGLPFLVPAHPGSRRKIAVKHVCMCVTGLKTFLLSNEQHQYNEDNMKLQGHTQFYQPFSK